MFAIKGDAKLTVLHQDEALSEGQQGKSGQCFGAQTLRDRVCYPY